MEAASLPGARALPALLLLFLLASPALSQAPAVTPETVLSLAFRGDGPVPEERLAGLTALVPGRPLTPGAVRAALRDLFATRLFSDLWIETAPDAGGVHVVVAYTRATTLHRLTVSEMPRRGELLGILDRWPGDRWEEADAAAVEQSTRAFLRSRGYFRPRVEVLVSAGPDDSSVDVELTIVRGELSRTAPPKLLGSIGSLPAGTLTEAQLVKAVKLGPGKAFREVIARADVDRLNLALRKAGHLQADVQYEDVEYDEKTGLATARYRVAAGPRVVLSVEGAPESLVKGDPDSPWSRGDIADEESLQRLGAGVKRRLQEGGYHEAKVEVTLTSPTPGELLASYRIERGARFSIARLTVDGVNELSRGEVLSPLRTRPRGLLQTGRLVDEDLASDRDAIAGLYRARGFASVKVEPAVVTRGDAPYTLDVRFALVEGPRATVSERTFSGMFALSDAEREKLAPFTPGEVFDPGKVEEDVERLRAEYEKRGYPDARVEATTVLSSAPGAPLVVEGAAALPGAAGTAASSSTVSVRYEAVEGSSERFGKTVIRGQKKTRYSFLTRQLAHQEGEPFALSRLFTTQQRLSRLGIFSRVELSVLPKDPETSSRTVIVTLAESKPWSLTYGVGVEYDERKTGFNLNPRVSFGVSYANLFGRAVIAALDTRYTIRETRVVASLRAPALLGGQTPFSLTAFRTKEIRSIEVSRLGSYLEAERRLSPKVKAALRYQYEIVESTADPLALSPTERQDQKIDISSIGPGIVLDSRDDITNPRKGFFVSLDLKYAFPFLGATASFVKGYGQIVGYQRLGSTTLAVALRVGAIEPARSCTPESNPTCAKNLEIPVAERFFAGGRSTHRAFAQDELAIEGETQETLPDRVVYYGGNGLLVGNVELRVPVKGDFGISLFIDTGNVWADYRSIGLEELRTGVGGGIHYLTPVGPLRLEYGWKLRRAPGDSSGELSFSIGFPF